MPSHIAAFSYGTCGAMDQHSDASFAPTSDGVGTGKMRNKEPNTACNNQMVEKRLPCGTTYK